MSVVRDPVAVDAALAEMLPAGSLYAVGGRVRDEFRSALDETPRPPKDLDYVVTGVALPSLVERLERLGRVDVVGASFAVVKVTFDGVTVDVALPRRERSTGVRHRDFVVEFGAEIPLEEDLGRRDFRMNMIARRIGDDAIVDPYGGRDDIAAGRVDLVRPEAFVEDPLRMLRAAQFAARFAYVVTDATMAAMRDAAETAATISPERVYGELTKLLEEAARPSIGIEILRHGGVLDVLLPELLEGVGMEQNRFHAYDVYGHLLATLDAAAPTTVDRIAALLHDVGKPRTKDGPHFYQHEVLGAEMTGRILARLRMPSDAAALVVRLVRHHMYAHGPELTDAAVRRFIARVGVDALESLFRLRAADIVGSGLPPHGASNAAFEARVAEQLTAEVATDVGKLGVGGADVLAALARRAGKPVRGGPLVGEILRALLEFVHDDPSRNDPVVLRAEIDRLVERSGG